MKYLHVALIAAYMAASVMLLRWFAGIVNGLPTQLQHDSDPLAMGFLFAGVWGMAFASRRLVGKYGTDAVIGSWKAVLLPPLVAGAYWSLLWAWIWLTQRPAAHPAYASQICIHSLVFVGIWACLWLVIWHGLCLAGPRGKAPGTGGISRQEAPREES